MTREEIDSLIIENIYTNDAGLITGIILQEVLLSMVEYNAESAHTHANKSILDQLTQANLDVLSRLSIVDNKLRVNSDMYATGEISAYGVGVDLGGGAGASALSELNDVALTVPNVGDLLLYNGTHWVNRPQSTIMPDLSGYATIEYVNNAITTVDTDKTYIFVQGTPSNVWTVAHNLNKYPNVSVVDSGNTEVIGEIKYIDINTVQITFSSEFSGKAFCN